MTRLARVLVAAALLLGLAAGTSHAASPWPTKDCYLQAMSNMPHYVIDRALSGASVAWDKSLRRPFSMSGSFSTVFPVTTRGRHRIAMRVFHPPEGAEERMDLDAFITRYRTLKSYLIKMNKEGKRVSEIVDFTVVRHGMKIDNRALPIMKMPYLVARPLDEFVERRLDQGRPEKVGDIANDFRIAMKAMRRAKLAHGDLHVANVQVEFRAPGKLRFMDYDSMYAPPLAGLKNAEIGSPNFQHPSYHFPKRVRPFDEHMDHFSAMVIYTSLMAVHADPKLWQRFHRSDQLMLLFRGKEDFVDPSKSPVFAALQQSSSPVVQRLATQLASYCTMDPHQIPDLETSIANAETPWYERQAQARLAAKGGVPAVTGGNGAPTAPRAPAVVAPQTPQWETRPGWYENRKAAGRP